MIIRLIIEILCHHHVWHGPQLFCRVGWHREIVHGIIACVQGYHG